MRVHRIFATIAGTASFVIGVLRFFIPALGRNIPPTDGIIHIVTGLAFYAGVWLFSGKYARISNFILGVFYIGFGIIGGMNWPHIILGSIFALLGLVVKTK